MKQVFALTETNMQNAGAPMGMASTSVDSVTYFSKAEFAKAAAEKDYAKSGRAPFKWRKDKNGWTSGDLAFVMYDVKPITVVK